MSHPQMHVESSEGAHARRWLTLVLLAFAQFMLIVDITVVQVALPSIGDDLRLQRAALTWVVTTYTLVFGGLMIFGGRLADLLGARRALLTGLAIFTLASLTSGLAQNAAVLITGRAGQGIGAALMSPAALSILTTTFHGRERNRALGIWAAIGGAGAAIGVLLSGLLTAGPGWQWVFFVNVPIGVVIVVLIPRLVGPDRSRERQSLDVPGALLVTASTAALIYGLVHAGDAGWGSTGTLAAIGGAVIGYGAFALTEAKVDVPLMRPQTLAGRPVVSGTFLMLLATGLLLGLFFVTSLYFQHMLRFSALKTGLLFLPVAIAITIGAQIGAHLISRVGGRIIAVASFALVGAGAAMLTQVSPGDSVATSVLPGFVIAALGVGPVFVTATTTTLANVPAAESGVASGVVNTFHELGGSIGVAVVSTIAAASLSSAGTPDIGGFTDAYLASAIAAAGAALVALVLVPAGKPQPVAGHGHGHAH
ncbi:EmrB/QacA subfamily drug resistance transporter [Kribbella sp. VKM Ac-2571]|uniref:MFS transporter n=1 Tax=Kribbella sp. VKM Ac-2571 TaxID=2512222 RepID=UPI0010DD7025|nr:MFS transporter [Kribbella sp. VKM Ac-2571]TDO51083.1 EmrB/QacA subfamily drug resistance transporter [Kribbella sp. VKM Ac-2571]